jgi:hypothetical protein
MSQVMAPLRHVDGLCKCSAYRGRPELIDARSERYLPANALLDMVAVGLRCVVSHDAIQREIAFEAKPLVKGGLPVR